MFNKKSLAAWIIITVSFISPFYAKANWEKNFEIDQQLGLVNRHWHISLPRVRAGEITKKIKQCPPPYSQQPENAQTITVPPQQYQ